jgi:acylphosphatase
MNSKMVLVRVRIVISGRVQGVSFRMWVAREAAKRGIGGWVRNRGDGTVEALLEGPDEAVQELIVWAHSGPPAAEVDQVKLTREDYQGEFGSFSIH